MPNKANNPIDGASDPVAEKVVLGDGQATMEITEVPTSPDYTVLDAASSSSTSPPPKTGVSTPLLPGSTATGTPPLSTSFAQVLTNQAQHASSKSSGVTRNRPPIISIGPDGKKKISLSYTIAPDAGPVPMDCGISILVHGKNVAIRHYLNAIVASGVPASSITDASRIGQTVQVFFNSSVWALKLIADGLAFRGQRLEVLPVGVAPKRVTVSEVPSYTPEEVIIL